MPGRGYEIWRAGRQACKQDFIRKIRGFFYENNPKKPFFLKKVLQSLQKIVLSQILSSGLLLVPEKRFQPHFHGGEGLLSKTKEIKNG